MAAIGATDPATGLVLLAPPCKSWAAASATAAVSELPYAHSQVFASCAHHKRNKPATDKTPAYDENGDESFEFVALGNKCMNVTLQFVELCRMLKVPVLIEQPAPPSANIPNRIVLNASL